MSNTPPVVIGSRISELPETDYLELTHRIPASSMEGETVRVTIEQIRDILGLRGSDISFRAGTVADALAGILDAPADNTIPDIGPNDAGKTLVVNANGTAFELASFVTPLFKPITMTTPAANATGLGANGAYTFIVQAFAGDTVGFYPDYPVPLASRFVDVFEPGGNAAVKRFVVSGTGTAFPVDFTGSGLQTSHAYDFQAGYIDVQANTVLSQRVRATTGAQFKPGIGALYSGGRLAYERFGDGNLFDLVVATKSTEASRTWDGGTNALRGAFSRLNGPLNTTVGNNANPCAQQYALSITIGGVAGYLAAIDEARAISFNLAPNKATEAAFKAGGAEEFTNSLFHWSSTEENASNAFRADMVTGGNVATNSKTSGQLVRAIKRIPLTPPFAIGTAMEGGYLAAYFTDLSSGTPVNYMLIVADKATEVTRAWDNASGGALGGSTTSRTNGKSNDDTYIQTRPQFLAFNYCFSLVSGGKDDWYLGAIDEYLAMVRVNSSLPSAQRFTAGTTMWTSTEASSTNALRFNGEAELSASKTNSYGVRAVRRVVLPN